MMNTTVSLFSTTKEDNKSIREVAKERIFTRMLEFFERLFGM